LCAEGRTFLANMLTRQYLFSCKASLNFSFLSNMMRLLSLAVALC